MTILLGLFDITLCLTLVLLAWYILTSPDFFKAVVLFISFGLLMALGWIRLQAPDVALAEAAIGSGLTGALFLSALQKITCAKKQERRVDRDEERE